MSVVTRSSSWRATNSARARAYSWLRVICSREASRSASSKTSAGIDTVVFMPSSVPLEERCERLGNDRIGRRLSFVAHRRSLLVNVSSRMFGSGSVLLIANGRDEQIAILDSQLRWTLSRFCSIAWFGHALQPQQPLRQPPSLEPNPSCGLNLLAWFIRSD